jgi:hypothetical protein
MRRFGPRAVACALAVAAASGCGGDGGKRAATQLPRTAPSVGPGARHRPPSLSARAARGRPIAGLGCTRYSAPRFGVHLELFARRRVVLIPPGIGIAPPRTRSGAYVSGGRCAYPLRTREPTGVIEVEARPPTKTLGQFFAIWGQRPSGRAYVNGRRHRGDARAIRLTKHAQIVLEVGGYVRPHATYGFPPGL